MPNIVSTEGKWSRENITRSLKHEQYHTLNQTIVWLMLLWSMKRSICQIFLKMRGVTWSYKLEVVFTSSKLNVVYYQAKIDEDACGL